MEGSLLMFMDYGADCVARHFLFYLLHCSRFQRTRGLLVFEFGLAAILMSSPTFLIYALTTHK